MYVIIKHIQKSCMSCSNIVHVCHIHGLFPSIRLLRRAGPFEEISKNSDFSLVSNYLQAYINMGPDRGRTDFFKRQRASEVGDNFA